jgi:hypothetical protein
MNLLQVYSPELAEIQALSSFGFQYLSQVTSVYPNIIAGFLQCVVLLLTLVILIVCKPVFPTLIQQNQCASQSYLFRHDTGIPAFEASGRGLDLNFV